METTTDAIRCALGAIIRGNPDGWLPQRWREIRVTLVQQLLSIVKSGDRRRTSGGQTSSVEEEVRRGTTDSFARSR